MLYKIQHLLLMVLVVGLEPTRPCELRILSPVRLPFRHTSIMEVPPRFELGNKGFADLGLTTWRWYHFYNKKMERKTRFELATLALARQCSTTEPLPHNILLSCLLFYALINGGSYRTRTCDPLLVRQML